jgi:hypothetical protein
MIICIDSCSKEHSRLFRVSSKLAKLLVAMHRPRLCTKKNILCIKLDDPFYDTKRSLRSGTLLSCFPPLLPLTPIPLSLSNARPLRYKTYSEKQTTLNMWSTHPNFTRHALVPPFITMCWYCKDCCCYL